MELANNFLSTKDNKQDSSRKQKLTKSLDDAEIENLPRLPEDWKWVKLGEALILKSDKHNGSGESLFYIGLEHIEKDRGTLTQYVKIDTITTVKNSFKIGDLLYGKLRPYLNKVYLANEDGVCSTDILVFKSAGISNLDYSKYFFLSRRFVSDMTHNSSGVNLPRVSTKYLQEYPFPLPPLPEQRAIVSRIEQLFSELDNGVANLRLAQEQLKVYRQAVLKKAFEGELTRKWREQQTDLPDAQDLLEQIRKEREEATKASGKKVKPVKPLNEDEIAELPGLPEGWRWVKMGEACDKIFDGTHFSPKNNPTGDYKYITAKNIKEGYLDLTNISYVTKKDHSEIYSRCDVKKGDVLYIKDGATTGKACVNPLEEEFSLLSSVGVFRVNEKNISPKYIEHYLNAEVTRHQMLKNIAGVAITRLTLVKLTNSALVLPPLPEQHTIVEEIETRLSVCDKMAQDIDEALEKAEALRQSILKKAFEGKLLSERELAEVRMAEDWEPAEVLLERIKVKKEGKEKR